MRKTWAVGPRERQENIWRLRAKLITIALSALLMTSAVALGQTSDTNPPQLVEFDFNPKMIDVTAGPQNVTVTARITDDLSGAFGFWVVFTSPTGNQFHQGFVFRTAGTELDGTYSGTVEIPQYVESGTWEASVFSLGDGAGNFVSFDTSNLTSLGFPTDLAVASNPDTTPPSVVSATFTPSVLDVSGGDQVVTLDLRLTDDVSGVDFDGFPHYYVAFLSSPNFRQHYSIPVPDFSQILGTALDGTWRLMWTIPQHSEAGTWSFGLNIRDNAGNALNTTAGTFDVISTVQDLTPPVLTGLSFSPAVVDTSAGPATVRVSLDLTDDLSGVDFSLASPNGGNFHGVFFQSPSSAQFRSVCCGEFSMTSGTVLDGTWEADIFFPQYSEAGTWKLGLSNVTDHVRNGLHMNAEQLEAALFPTDLVVVRPSLEGDGVVGPGGGTVTDETFGEKAEITFPAGAVAGDTDVAIDVFPDPLAVETPTGFQGPGTYFVNISLTPEPTYPFAPPGATVTLPLPEFLNPGTAIPLFFVNTTTGTLDPMPDAATGLQVIGTVNGDGLSATFSGISHFSILVGLLPDVIQVRLDIKPDAEVNSLSVKTKGTLPVAIISTGSFNAVSAVNQSTLTFGKTGDEASLSRCNGKGEDINRDGRRDLVCHFHIQLTGFAPGDTQGVLKGKTWANENVQGTDSIRVVK